MAPQAESGRAQQVLWSLHLYLSNPLDGVATGSNPFRSLECIERTQAERASVGVESFGNYALSCLA
ncbi:hypothetical protein J2X71_001509 [Rhizobium sp. 1399]|nr:hypothetical protein [Rhizobium sp. 1399]